MSAKRGRHDSIRCDGHAAPPPGTPPEDGGKMSLEEARRRGWVDDDPARAEKLAALEAEMETKMEQVRRATPPPGTPAREEGCGDNGCGDCRDCDRLAYEEVEAERQRVTARVEQLEGALREILAIPSADVESAYEMKGVARAALAGSDD